MLKLNLQYLGQLMQTADTLDKSLMLGKTEGRRKRGRQRIRWLNSITYATDRNLGNLQEMMRYRDVYPAAVHGDHKESNTTGRLNHNSEFNYVPLISFYTCGSITKS